VSGSPSLIRHLKAENTEKLFRCFFGGGIVIKKQNIGLKSKIGIKSKKVVARKFAAIFLKRQWSGGLKNIASFLKI